MQEVNEANVVNETNAVDSVNKVNAVGTPFNMKMNAKKTVTMVISSKDPKLTININIDNNPIKHVDNFVYVGYLITDDGRCEHEMKRRIEIARAAFRKLNDLLTCYFKKFNFTTRKRILKCYVFTTLLYGSETWTITKTMEDRINAVEMWTNRRMLRIPWTDKISNEEVIQRVTPEQSIMCRLKTSKLKYFRHINSHETLQKSLCMENKKEKEDQELCGPMILLSGQTC